MTKYKAKGTLVIIGETREFGSGFTARRFVVDTTENPNYKSPIEFTLKKDRVGDIDGYQPGEAIEVEFSIDGRQWDGPNGTRFFTDFTVWHIARVSATATTATAAAATPAAAATAPAMKAAVDEWKKSFGEDKAAFVEFCRKLKPGKRSNEYTIVDWEEITAAIIVEKTKAEDDPDDIPF